jgi:hypothetical protein
MAPQANKIPGPTAIRSLASASSIYRRTLEDTAETIRAVIDEGLLVEREMDYARLLITMTATERDLRWLMERCSYLLGETDEGHTGSLRVIKDVCPDCGSDQRALIIGHCGHGWHYGEV